jgi:hypothetical protein
MKDGRIKGGVRVDYFIVDAREEETSCRSGSPQCRAMIRSCKRTGS